MNSALNVLIKMIKYMVTLTTSLVVQGLSHTLNAGGLGLTPNRDSDPACHNQDPAQPNK